MRLPSLILGFSLGAFLMWKVGVPDLPVDPCAITTDCAQAPVAIAPVIAVPAAPGLRIVVYDPNSDAEVLTQRG